MAFTLADFRAEFPEFSGVVDATVQRRLDRAERYLDQPTWGDCYDDAILYLAAHELALSLRRGAMTESDGVGTVEGGTIQSASVDGVSTSFAVPNYATQGTANEAYLSMTPYGQYYLQLRDTCLSTGRIGGTRFQGTLI